MSSSSGMKFLVCINCSDNSDTAFRIACIKAARNDAIVELLIVVNVEHEKSLFGVGNAILMEKMRLARNKINSCIEVLRGMPNKVRVSCRISEGSMTDCIMRVVEEDSSMVMLFLGVYPSDVQSVVNKMRENILVPVMIVPDSLTEQQISELSM